MKQEHSYDPTVLEELHAALDAMEEVAGPWGICDEARSLEAAIAAAQAVIAVRLDRRKEEDG